MRWRFWALSLKQPPLDPYNCSDLGYRKPYGHKLQKPGVTHPNGLSSSTKVAPLSVYHNNNDIPEQEKQPRKTQRIMLQQPLSESLSAYIADSSEVRYHEGPEKERKKQQQKHTHTQIHAREHRGPLAFGCMHVSCREESPPPPALKHRKGVGTRRIGCWHEPEAQGFFMGRSLYIRPRLFRLYGDQHGH